MFKDFRLTGKLLLFFSLILLLIVFVFGFIWNRHNNNLQRLQESYIKEFQLTFSGAIDILDSSLQVNVNDNSYWDEMIEFVSTKNLSWAHENLIVPMEDFHHDYILVYDNHKNLVFSYQKNTQSSSIVKSIPMTTIDNEKPMFSNYFISVDKKVIRIFSSPIQPSLDVKRVSKPQGYLVVGKIWTPEHVVHLHKITHQSIKLLDDERAANHYDFVHALRDNNGKSVAYLGVKLAFNPVIAFDQLSRIQFYTMTILGTLLIVFVLFMGHYFLIKPLRLISQAISTDDTKLLLPYLNQHDEIGDIARVIEKDSFNKGLLKSLSNTDELTGLYNRRYFSEIFPKFINGARRKNESVCFMLLDIDFFKNYNDCYGHQKGDETLKEFANVLKNTLGRSDEYAFRFGGEEFVLIFKADNIENVAKFAETIREAIIDLGIPHKESSVHSVITASVGMVCVNANMVNGSDDIYKKADTLLYLAKENGRNRVEVEY